MVQKHSHWFPIACAYPWERELVEESEVVLLIKTQLNYQDPLEVIHQQMTYTNFTAQITPTAVNYGFLEWLYAIRLVTSAL